MQLRPTGRLARFGPAAWLPAAAALFLAGCSLLEPPQGPIIPTAPPVVEAVDFSDLVLVVNPSSPTLTPAVDPEIEALLGAVSQQQLTAYVRTLEAFGTRHTLSEIQSPTTGIGAARQWIYDEFLRVNSGALQVSFDDFAVNVAGFESGQRNVIAELPGISGYPGMYVLMAHYDSRNEDPDDGTGRAPGANDNATGVAILLELARLMSSRSWNQTVVFAAFAAEEQGTFGSRHYVQNMLLSGRAFAAAINNDIVGGRAGVPLAIRAFAPGPDTSPSRAFVRYVDLVGGLYLPAFRVDRVDAADRAGRYGDQREFHNVGIAAARFTEYEEDFSSQHNMGDTSDKLGFDYLRQVAQLDLAVLANLAGAPIPPAVPIVAPMADPGGYILTWQPDSAAAGYAISFRPVGSPEFPPFRFVATSEAGNIAFTGLDPNVNYAVSMAALDINGRISNFSPEVIIGPS
ncbi:MAG: M20/M25/M40 family metallo-hydrolase [Candidatus Promineifilaceae bacterium]